MFIFPDAFCKALQTVRTKQNTKSTEKFMEEILETVVVSELCHMVTIELKYIYGFGMA